MLWVSSIPSGTRRGSGKESNCRFRSMRTSSLAATSRPSEPVEDNLSPSNFKRDLPLIRNKNKIFIRATHPRLSDRSVRISALITHPNVMVA